MLRCQNTIWHYEKMYQFKCRQHHRLYVKQFLVRAPRLVSKIFMVLYNFLLESNSMPYG